MTAISPASKRSVGLRVWRVMQSICVAIVALLLIIHFTPLLPWYANVLAGDWAEGKGDTLIVLAADIDRGGILGRTTYLRTVYALQVYREGGFHAIVSSGGVPRYAPVSAAESIRSVLLNYGVPPDVVHAEGRSASTRENAMFTKNMVAGWPGTKVLLTSDYHMFRARRAFEKVGLKVIPHPVPDVLKRSSHLAERIPCFLILAVETVKIGYYEWKGWI